MAKTPDNRPWAPHPFPRWVIKEFVRRQNDIGLQYIDNSTKTTWGDKGNGEGTWKDYKGPMVPWVRFFSNGNGTSVNNPQGITRDGFVMFQGEGFEKSYGIQDNKGILGYDAKGNPHTLNVSNNGNTVSFPSATFKGITTQRVVQKFLPPPGIVSVDAILQKERIRKVTINWKCYGFAQLEYLTPYFLTPKISAFVEFGWNHFNPASLLNLSSDLNNLNNLKELFTNSGSLLYDQNIRDSYGLYDVTMGIISGFDFSTQDGFTYDCKTEILSKHANYSGVQVNGATKVTSDNTSTSVQSSFSTYLEKRLTKIPNCIIGKGKNFMEPLDQDEIKAFNSPDPGTKFIKLKNFYNDKVEDRFFVGRKTEYGDEKIRENIAKYDWDNSDQKDIWVTFGFLIELANLFFTQLVDVKIKDNPPYKLYQIKTDEVIIGAHPNLISCDGSILLIPNALAPKFNAGIVFPTSNPEDNDYQKQTGFGNPSIFSPVTPVKVSNYNDLKPYDRTVSKVLKTGISVRSKSTNVVSVLGSETLSLNVGDLNLGPFTQKVDTNVSVGIGGAVMRDDLDGIINRFRYKRQGRAKSFSFPQWTDEPDTKKEKGYWGYLNDLYINKNLIIECAKSADTVESFYNDLLNKISNAAGKFWDLAVIEDDQDSGFLRIVDKKFVQYNNMKIYQFDVGAANRFIKSINFTAQLSNVAANQTIAGASANNTFKSPIGSINANQSLQFPYGDRFNLIPPTGPIARSSGGVVDNNLEAIKQLQNSPENSSNSKGSYIMSFKSKKGTKKGISRADAATAGGRRNPTPGNPSPPGSRGAAAAAAGLRGNFNSSNPSPPGSRGAAAAAAGYSGNFSSGQQTDGGGTGEEGWNIVNLVLPNETLLLAILNDLDTKSNSNIYGGQQPGFTVEMTLQGISGLRTFQLFSLKNLPSPYSEHEIICQIVDITHKIDNSNWTTTIKAGIRAIRGQVIKVTTDGDNSFELETVKYT